MHETFCILPWRLFNISMDGSGQLCCRATRAVRDSKGIPLRLHDTPFDGIWNSDYMAAVRRDLLEGKRRDDCGVCYEHEARMRTSMRIESNEAWLRGLTPEQRHASFSQLEASTTALGYRVATSPDTLHLWFGSQCNLKCRMCNSSLSSRIATDPVHSRWHPERPLPQPTGHRRFHDGRTWAESPSVLLGEVLREGNVVRHISFAGGEPLLQPQIEPFLQTLIDRSAAEHMTLYFSTNGTVFSTSLVEKLQRFQKVTLAVSIDGLGALNDYIRHPSRWDQLMGNLRRMQALRWLDLEIDPTVQAYNALSLTSLLRFCDAEGLRCIPNNVLLQPKFLSLSVLPDGCRRLASERFEAYARTCAAEKKEAVAGIVRHLEGPPPPEQPSLLGTFREFTRDLDASRNESLAETEPELSRMLDEGRSSGGMWPAGWRRLIRDVGGFRRL